MPRTPSPYVAESRRNGKQPQGKMNSFCKGKPSQHSWDTGLDSDTHGASCLYIPGTEYYSVSSEWFSSFRIRGNYQASSFIALGCYLDTWCSKKLTRNNYSASNIHLIEIDFSQRIAKRSAGPKPLLIENFCLRCSKRFDKDFRQRCNRKPNVKCSYCMNCRSMHNDLPIFQLYYAAG